MSYFYLNPNGGFSQFHTLENCILQRKSFLDRLINNKDDVSFDEHLLEGSALDNVGHFLLGLIVHSSDSPSLLDSYKRGESALFFIRLNSARPDDVRLLCKSALRQVKCSGGSLDFPHLKALLILCRKLIVKHLAEHVFGENHSKQCTHYHADIHFSLCSALIAKRRVELKNGIAFVPCGLWKSFIQSLFDQHMKFKFNHMKTDLAADPRWREVILKLTQSNTSNETGFAQLSHKDVDKLIDSFPLCMKNLHTILRHNHRLSHDERFRYSLFLKDINLPLGEAICFWKSEYSKDGCKKASCSHHWSKDEKKFIYGIRHMYGLEGSRKTYKTPDCSMIISRPYNGGGCAFKHCDNDYLEKIRNKNISAIEWDRIVAKKKLGHCKEACFLYQKQMISLMFNNSVSDKLEPIHSPVNYFNSMTLARKKFTGKPSETKIN